MFALYERMQLKKKAKNLP